MKYKFYLRDTTSPRKLEKDLRFFIFLCCLKDIRVFQKFVDYFFCKSFYWKPCFNGFVVTAWILRIFQTKYFVCFAADGLSPVWVSTRLLSCLELPVLTAFVCFRLAFKDSFIVWRLSFWYLRFLFVYMFFCLSNAVSATFCLRCWIDFMLTIFAFSFSCFFLNSFSLCYFL